MCTRQDLELPEGPLLMSDCPCSCIHQGLLTAPTTQVMAELAKGGVKMIALRCAGFDRVDLKV